MREYLSIDQQILGNSKRLFGLAATILVTNVIFYGLIGWYFGPTIQTKILIGVAVFVCANYLLPIAKGIPHSLGYHLILKFQLKKFFSKILEENNFRASRSLAGNGTDWLQNIKLDESLPVDRRIIAVEFQQIVQSVVSANENLFHAEEKISNILTGAIRQYLQNPSVTSTEKKGKRAIAGFLISQEDTEIFTKMCAQYFD